METKEKFEEHKPIYYCIIILFVIFIIFYLTFSNSKDKGSYDYCIEWIGFSNGTLNRDSLLFTCYNIVTDEFYCDYDIDKNTQILEIKNILNVTKNDEGGIIGIDYAEPNYFECKRWLKSKHLNN